eukprot:gene10931-biopygen12365
MQTNSSESGLSTVVRTVPGRVRRPSARRLAQEEKLATASARVDALRAERDGGLAKITAAYCGVHKLIRQMSRSTIYAPQRRERPGIFQQSSIASSPLRRPVKSCGRARCVAALQPIGPSVKGILTLLWHTRAPLACEWGWERRAAPGSQRACGQALLFPTSRDSAKCRQHIRLPETLAGRLDVSNTSVSNTSKLAF